MLCHLKILHKKQGTQDILPKIEIKDNNVIIDGQKFLDQPVKTDMRTYGNNQKITTGNKDDYRTGYLLDYPYFKEHYKLIAIDVSKQQALDADPKAI